MLHNWITLSLGNAKVPRILEELLDSTRIQAKLGRNCFIHEARMCGPEGKQEGGTWVRFVVKARSVFPPLTCILPPAIWELGD